MSNGSLAELPPENIPDSITLPDEIMKNSVMLLLPHNKYLLGTDQDKWLYGKLGTNPQNVYLYDNEVLSLVNDGAQPTIIPAKTVNALRKKLFMNIEPPGTHQSTVLMMRTFMRNHPVFNTDNADFLDTKFFNDFMNQDEILRKTYWTLRFAISRGEMEITGRLKSWLKTGPELFNNPEYQAKIWFSLLNLPEKEAIHELEELLFSKGEIMRLSMQNFSPMVLYNPASGWLILGRFGRGKDVMFSVWLYVNHEFWQELRERKKLTISEIINTIWAENDTRMAMIERAKYKGDDI